jgi:hypothetical protein
MRRSSLGLTRLISRPIESAVLTVRCCRRPPRGGNDADRLHPRYHTHVRLSACAVPLLPAPTPARLPPPSNACAVSALRRVSEGFRPRTRLQAARTHLADWGGFSSGAFVRRPRAPRTRGTDEGSRSADYRRRLLPGSVAPHPWRPALPAARLLPEPAAAHRRYAHPHAPTCTRPHLACLVIPATQA